jgi:ATP-dependent Lon protease
MDIIEAVEPTEIKTADEALPLLPLKNVVILPKSIIPIIVGRDLSIKAVEFALKHNRSLFITAQKDPKTENPMADDLFQIGTRSAILQVMRMPNGALKILAEGICRAKMTALTQVDGFFNVTYSDVVTPNVNAIWRQLSTLYQEYAKLNDKASTEIITPVNTAADMDYITDTIAVHSNLTFNEII